jgi:hypothetical protein
MGPFGLEQERPDRLQRPACHRILRRGAHRQCRIKRRVADWFSNGQVRNGQVFYELRVLDADRIEMILDRGGTLQLQPASGPG